MSALVRIPLAWPIGTRTGGSTSKDPYIRNGTLERYGDLAYTLKRPGTTSLTTLGGSGVSQGLTYWNGGYWAVVGDTLYTTGGSSHNGADGTAWTQSTTPAWAATQGQGTIVFKNRMWMLGGVTASAGIWSSQDGKVWAVNAGGQPWGFRDHMGIVEFQQQLFVLGGFNLTLGTCFNDVWSSPDGTNWTDISVDAVGVANTNKWPVRTNHMAIATNNGIYIMGGQDTTTSTFYADVWYSADGVSWAELNTSAPWGARTGASCFWFNNNIWVVGGADSGGTELNDAWYSPDGITWTQATAAAFSGGGRFYSYSCVYRNAMWMIGGITSGGRSKEIYVSTNGITWFLDSPLPSWSARADGGNALVFGVPQDVDPFQYQTMWILGGDNGSSTLREVWRADLNVALTASYVLSPITANLPFQFTTAQNGQILVFKNATNAYTLQSGTLSPVVDPNYPPITVPGVAQLNAFTYVMTTWGEIHASAFDDPTTWPSLNFVTADYEDDAGVCLAKFLNYVVALGVWTTQFFFDNGANQPTGSPLAPYITANLRVGCVSAATVATVANTLVWVGQTKEFSRTVVMLNGLTPQTISTPYVDKILAVTDVSSLAAFGFSIGGHQYYALKIGAASALVYDFTSQEWYEWDTFSYLYFVTNFATGAALLLTNTNGNLVKIDPAVYTDAISGTFSFEVQTLKVDFGNNAFKYWGDATLIGDRSPATPSIYTTDDDYQTYTLQGTVDMSLARPQINRTGMSRRRAWKITQTDNNPARWENIEDAYSQGES